MKETLFPLPISPSPRLQWLAKHQITTHHHDAVMEEDSWCAFIGTWDDITRDCVRMEDDGRLCYGATEEEAVKRLAVAQGIKLWNQP